MKEFPESAILFRRQIVFADVGPDGKFKNVPDTLEKQASTKIWQFISPQEIKINITSSSLAISSQHHKTYNLDGGGDKFRDTIQYITERFFEVIKIPIIKRLGLRYVDECPLFDKTNESFLKYYNSSFPLSRFKIEDANEMSFITVAKRGTHFIRFIESLKPVGDNYKLILDFDGYAEKLTPEDYLSVTDSLHSIISDEFENSIKEELKTFMRSSRSK